MASFFLVLFSLERIRTGCTLPCFPCLEAVQTEHLCTFDKVTVTGSVGRNYCLVSPRFMAYRNAPAFLVGPLFVQRYVCANPCARGAYHTTAVLVLLCTVVRSIFVLSRSHPRPRPQDGEKKNTHDRTQKTFKILPHGSY